MVKIYMMGEGDVFSTTFPDTRFYFYVDDLTLAKEGLSYTGVLLDLCRAAVWLYRVIILEWGALVAEAKAMVLASSPRLGRALRAFLGRLGGAALKAGGCLGVDFAPGAARNMVFQ